MSKQIDREKRLEIAIAAIEKQCGKGSIMTLDNAPIQKIETISTGSLSLDKATGIGGLPMGRVTELYGAESSGKSTLCLHIVANIQKNGGTAAFVDMEHALDPAYTRKLGVDTSKLKISQPDHAEQALNIIDHLARSNAVDLIILDSVAALVPEVELDGGMDDQQMGLVPRLMSKALRKLTGIVANTKTCLIFVNQTRMNIGQMFGDPTTTPGGKALKFHASMRIELKRMGWIKDKDLVVGSIIRANVKKNKLAPPYRICEFPVIHGQGISELDELINIAISNGIITKSGSWLSMDGVQLAQGKIRTKELLHDNKDVYVTLKTRVIESINKE